MKNSNPAIYLCVLVCACFLFLSPAARATTGNEILPKCKAATISNAAGFDSGYCAGFIDAALETTTIWKEDDDYEKRTHDTAFRFCIPDEVTNGQIMLVFVKYLEDHPERLHYSATLLLVEALRTAFPCPVKQ